MNNVQMIHVKIFSLYKKGYFIGYKCRFNEGNYDVDAYNNHDAICYFAQVRMSFASDGCQA